jgi:hypothetical protein
MARQSHTPVDKAAPYASSAPVLTFIAADSSNFEEVIFTGREMVIAQNTSEDTPFDVTIESVASATTKRTGDIVQEVAFGTVAVFGPQGLDGFRQSDGTLHFKGEDPTILFAVIRI